MGQANQGGSVKFSQIPRNGVATRFEPTRRDASLWWESAPETSSRPKSEPFEADRKFALLVDISQTGASIALDHILKPGNGVWLRLEGESLTDWTEAEVVGVTTTTHGPHLVRLAFRDPCPFETLRTAVCG